MCNRTATYPVGRMKRGGGTMASADMKVKKRKHQRLRRQFQSFSRKSEAIDSDNVEGN